MKDYQKRINATFLQHSSPDKAYEWLSTNWKLPEGEDRAFFQRFNLGRERKALEYLLLRRKIPLIDLGLAQFGHAPYILKTVFKRGNTGVRCAVLANLFLFQNEFNSVLDLAAVIKRGNRMELDALALNPHLSDKCYESLINRTDGFSDLNDNDYHHMLYLLGDNARISTPYDDTYMCGFSEYSYDNVFSTAWQLTATVPTTQKWASVLAKFLQKAQPPVGFNDIEQVIERWKIDLPNELDCSDYNHSCDLRSRLADLLDANESLLNSTDLALRRSFYRRFSPFEFKGWSKFLEKDGEDFVIESLRNHNLWRSHESRSQLEEISWD